MKFEDFGVLGCVALVFLSAGLVLEVVDFLPAFETFVTSSMFLIRNWCSLVVVCFEARRSGYGRRAVSYFCPVMCIAICGSVTVSCGRLIPDTY